MDFEKTLKLLIADFNKEGVRYALIGGFGLGVHGVARTTIDLDFLIAREDIHRIERIMKKYDYRSVFISENVSQYVSDVKTFGRVDFLHAFRSHSLKMLERATNRTVFGGGLSVKVLRPEDIIGLKVQAWVNDPSRKTKELADIAALMQLHGSALDWDLLREYFALFKKTAEYTKLKAKYGNPDRR